VSHPRQHVLLIALVLVPAVACPALAQTAPASDEQAVTALPPGTDPPPEETPYLEQSSLFMERTHFGFRVEGMRSPDPAGNILFEARPALHIFLWNALSRYTAIRKSEPNHADLPLAVSLTFNPDVRMLATDSEPVRSPSWKIRANAQLFYKQPQTHALKVSMMGMRLSFGHYSNGQEGCPFQVERLESDGCAHFDYYDSRNPPDLRLVNRATGDFSLNHLTLAVHQRWITLHQLARDRHKRRHMSEHSSHTIGASVDRIESVGIGGISPQLRALYGSWAVQGEYRYETTLGTLHSFDSTARLALEASAHLAIGAADAVYPLRMRGEVAYTIPSWSDLGLFVAVSHGQDYYNLQFVDKVDYQFLFGLVVDLYPRPRHACIAADDAGCRVPEAKR
jgi:hypothetical protein